MHRPLIMVAVGVTAAALLVVAAATFWYERPTRLSVAISSADADDFALIEAAQKLLKFGRNEVRLQLHPVDGAAAAAAAVDAGQADLAVIRTDVKVPNQAQTVVILHRDSTLLVAPGSGDIKTVGDLKDHTLGVVRRGPGNEHLVETTLAQYEIAADTVKVVDLKAENVAAAIAAKTVDAVLAVDVISSPRLRDIVKAVAAGGEAPVLVPIEEAAAIAQRSPAYEKTEVVIGAFGGTPPRPAEEYDTLSITHRLVANENVDQNLISELTRFFLTEKSQLGSTVPLAQSIEAPSTDKGAALPVHAGSAAYIDDDEETFFDKYSDFIYIGAMLMGVLASGATAVMGRINGQRAASIETSVDRLLDMLGLVRAAPTLDKLNALQEEADRLLASALNAASASSSDDRRLSAFGLVLDQVRAAIRDRRAELASTAGILPPHLLGAAAE